MFPEFEDLNGAELELVLKAPVLVCILIAGADNNIDRKEIQGAIDLAKKKQKRSRARLLKYYNFLAEDFEDKLKVVLQSYPADAADRNPIIVDQLAQLNEIFPKLDKEFVREFYISMKEIAIAIAESSGGLLGMKSVGEEEARYIELSMIHDPAGA